ncbi:MAG TPA: alpha/beta hydrolase, partial [Burkholderiaceae bacterium]|nr:alpha/beta hydrolase [Burkholderiaceae bacterium]
GQRVLSFDRNVETAIYNTLPDNLDRLLRRHPLKCPIAFLGGLQSAEMKQVGMAMTEQITKGRISMVDGSHLFPMEKPLVTAAAIEAALLNLQSIS